VVQWLDHLILRMSKPQVLYKLQKNVKKGGGWVTIT